MSETAIKNINSDTLKILNKSIVMLALTYNCQCNCEHCGSSLFRSKKEKELTPDEIFKIIGITSELGANKIYFFGGEPLLSKGLFDYIKYSKSKGMHTKLDTNAYLLNCAMVEKLKNAGLDFIRVSLDSPDENVHDKLRGVKGIYKKALCGIKLCRDFNIKTCISTYVTKKTLRNGDIEKIIDIAESNDAIVRLLSPICSGKWKNKSELVLSNEDIKLLRNFLKKDKIFWEKIDDRSLPFSCHAIDNEMIHISAYGDTSPCCYWPKTYGNIRNKPIENLIKEMFEDIKKIRPEHIEDCPVNILKF